MTAQKPNESGPVEVEALFGSQVRGDQDHQSDRDILIVDEDRCRLQARTRVLEADGWSVAPYTFRKLEALAAKGALFIQHLKTESRIIQDSRGRFHSILSSYRPKACYASELRENGRLASLISSHPATTRGTLWAADVLYVTVRNFGVLRLAGDAVYQFGYATIINELVSRGIVGEAGKNALLQLRLLKSLYRSATKLSRMRAAGVIERALSALPRAYFPLTSFATDPLSILQTSISLPARASAYNRLRNIEKSYLALCALRPSASFDPSMQQLQRWIENPRMYANVAAIVELATLKALANQTSTIVSVELNKLRQKRCDQFGG
jgi:hypothetical protein